MQPENFRFGGGASETILHPIVLVAMLIAIALIFLLPRKYLIWPFLSIAFLVPLGQEILVGGLHFFVIRIIILAVALRILVATFSSKEGAFGGRLGTFDFVFLAWALCRATAAILVFSFASGAIVYQCGFLLDAVGAFFVLRYLIRDEDDIYRTIRAFGTMCAIIAVCMVFERFRQIDLFGLLGGVRVEPEVRGGVVRSQGPFQHEILAGTFAATLMPLFYLLWKNGKSRLLAIIGAISATIMVITSHSSTPALAWAAGLAAIFAFPARRHMRLIRWAVVAMIVSLHLVMKAPVWFLIQRVDVVGGSSGYHRAMLVNDFIVHFKDWWLLGTTENARWGFNMWDLCNQFVAEGQVGGLATFLCFVAMIVTCFSWLGRARHAVDGQREKEWYFWLFGCALFSHIVAFFGISYFDQTRDSWFALLAMIVAATAPYLLREPVKNRSRARLPFTPLRPAYGTTPAQQPSAPKRRPAFGRFAYRPEREAN